MAVSAPVDQVAALAGAVRDGDLSPEQLESLAQLVEAVSAAMRTTWDPLEPTDWRPKLVHGWQGIADSYCALILWAAVLIFLLLGV